MLWAESVWCWDVLMELGAQNAGPGALGFYFGHPLPVFVPLEQ